MVAVNAIGNGFAAMKALLALPKYLQPTAVLAMSDVLAHGAMQACAEDGVDIPADLAIVGFDDAPFAVEIGLSTVSQSPSDKAEIAVRYALGEDVYVTHLPARLIDRQTA